MHHKVQRGPRLLPALALGTALWLALVSSGAHAQEGTSRAVVQPLPAPEVEILNAALRRLARDPRDISALIDAGNASVKLDDMDAAEGFFARAADVQPNNPRVQAGMASVLLRDENPFDALRLYEAAERGGVPPLEMAADRGLAFDLVGNNASAQEQYRLILARGEDEEVRKRYALSLAIAGDQYGSEAVLLPLLQKQDLSAYRARAFALAALNKTDEAVSIAETILPARISSRMAPYLRYMPRLTKAQQAAAANFGNFPKAEDIGRDDPRIAQYGGTAQAQVAARGSDRLVPGGAPLGQNNSQSGRAPQQRPAATAPSSQPAAQATRSQAPVVQPASQPVSQRTGELPPVSRPVVQQTPAPARQAAAQVAQASETQAPSQPVSQRTGELPPQATPVVQQTTVSREPPAQQTPAAQTPTTQAPAQTAAAQAPAMQMPVLTSRPIVNSAQAAQQAPAPAPSPSAQAAPEPVGLSEAFADFNLAAGTDERAAGAVDITKIKPPREVKPELKPEPPKPEPPKHPSRIWVQVATGRDVSAMPFDWRRLSRNSKGALDGKEAYTVPWGQANRLVTGPFSSQKAAQDMMNKLKEAGVDSFVFTSSEGEEVKPLATK